MTFERSPGRMWAETNKQKIVDAYQGGATVREIAEWVPGGSYQIVRQLLVDSGVQLRNRGAIAGSRPPAPDRVVTVAGVRQRVVLPAAADGDLVDVRDVRVLAGLTQEEVALGMGVTGPRVSQIESLKIDVWRVGKIARLVEVCGARLVVLVEFGEDERVALYDTFAGDDGGDGDDGGG